MASTRKRPFEKLPDPPEELAAEQRAKYEAGETTQQRVAEAFGCSPQWARAFMERLAWAKPKRGRAAAKPAPAKPRPRKAATRVKTPASAQKIAPAAEADIQAGEAPVEHGDIMLRLAGRALRLMDKLERKLANEDLSDEHMRLMTSLVKMLAEFQKSGIARAEGGTSGDANDHAADDADFAADMARARSDLVARIDAAIAARDMDENSGGAA